MNEKASHNAEKRSCPNCGEVDCAQSDPTRRCEQYAETIAHEILLPKGYYRAATGDVLPFFDNEGRQIGLLLHADGSVTWQMRGRNGEVLEGEARA